MKILNKNKEDDNLGHIWEDEGKWKRCIPGQLLTFLSGFFEYYSREFPEFKIITVPLEIIVYLSNYLLNNLIESLVAPFERLIGKNISKIIPKKENDTDKKIKELEESFDQEYQHFTERSIETKDLEKIAYEMLANLTIVMDRFVLFWGRNIIYPLFFIFN